jgi:hypothetical protein
MTRSNALTLSPSFDGVAEARAIVARLKGRT